MTSLDCIERAERLSLRGVERGEGHGMFNLQPCGQATKFVLETALTYHGEVGTGRQIEEVRHRFDQAMMSLQPIEPTDSADEGRSRDLGWRRAHREGLCSVADEPDSFLFDPESASPCLNLEVTHRDQPLRPAEQRSQGLPLQRPDHLSHTAGVATAVERSHRGNPRPLGRHECHGGQEVVHTLHMDEVVASLPNLPNQRRRNVEIRSPGPRWIPSHGQQSLVFQRW